MSQCDASRHLCHNQSPWQEQFGKCLSLQLQGEGQKGDLSKRLRSESKKQLSSTLSWVILGCGMREHWRIGNYANTQIWLQQQYQQLYVWCEFFRVFKTLNPDSSDHIVYLDATPVQMLLMSFNMFSAGKYLDFLATWSVFLPFSKSAKPKLPPLSPKPGFN